MEETKIFPDKSGPGLRRRKLCTPKRGRVRHRKYPDTIVYNYPNELCEKLSQLVIAKEACDTGLDNSIRLLLDELFLLNSINKDEYYK